MLSQGMCINIWVCLLYLGLFTKQRRKDLQGKSIRTAEFPQYQHYPEEEEDVIFEVGLPCISLTS